MSVAKMGDRVRVHYTGTDDMGAVFDSSRQREPLEFTIGGRQVLPGFENTVVGMSPGDSRQVAISAREAYGEYNDDLLLEVGREQVPPGVQPQVGQRLQIRTADGRAAVVLVADVSEEKLILDANHPLAGKDLSFDIELVAIS